MATHQCSMSLQCKSATCWLCGEQSEIEISESEILWCAKCKARAQETIDDLDKALASRKGDV